MNRIIRVIFLFFLYSTYTHAEFKACSEGTWITTSPLLSDLSNSSNNQFQYRSGFTDKDGNLLVHFNSTNSLDAGDGPDSLSKISASGQILWKKSPYISSPGKLIDYAPGNVSYLVGQTSLNQFALMQFDKNSGQTNWGKRFAAIGLKSSKLIVESGVTDRKGDIYLVGKFYGSMNLGCGTKKSFVANSSMYNGYDAFAVKLSGEDGHCLWNTVYGTNGDELASSVFIDPNQNVIIGGIHTSMISFGGAIFPGYTKEKIDQNKFNAFVLTLRSSDGFHLSSVSLNLSDGPFAGIKWEKHLPFKISRVDRFGYIYAQIEHHTEDNGFLGSTFLMKLSSPLNRLWTMRLPHIRVKVDALSSDQNLIVSSWKTYESKSINIMSVSTDTGTITQSKDYDKMPMASQASIVLESTNGLGMYVFGNNPATIDLEKNNLELSCSKITRSQFISHFPIQ